MVYFGWPQAHEDDAQRAAHAGLGILVAMSQLNDRLEQCQRVLLKCSRRLTRMSLQERGCIECAFFTLLAEAYGKSGQMEEGLAALAKAITLLEQTEERYYEAELHRFRGILLWARPVPNPVEAENAFRHALAVAQSQQAKSLKLRAATSLARL